jgi:hypothetical protein
VNIGQAGEKQDRVLAGDDKGMGLSAGSHSPKG